MRPTALRQMADFATKGKKIVAIGRNYAAHIKELGNTRPAEPFYFLKPTSSYLLPNRGPVELTRGSVIHYEVELGVVLGPTPARAVPAARANEHIAGYCLAVDYTNRSLQDAAKAQGLPWAAAKGFDTSCPVGEYIPKSEVKDHANLRLKLRVNGELKQDASTGLMLTPVEKLIEHVSSVMTLEEGDLLLTGTPAGVGPVKEGDEVEATLEQDGKVISKIVHLVKNRTDGYVFQQKA